jgi:hypothetical protein
MVWLGEGSEVKCYSLKDKQFKPSPFVPDILAVNPARSQVYQINGSVKAMYCKSFRVFFFFFFFWMLRLVM